MGTTQPIRNKDELAAFRMFYKDIHPNRRNYCLIVMGLNTALRISDLLKLKWDNVYNFEQETDNSYEVDIDLPGFKKDEIEAKLENGYLTISAAKGLDKEEKDGKYIRKERYSGAMSRSFYVGDELKQEDIKAKYEDGILKLSVPKKEQKKVETTKHIAIEG